MSEIKTNTHDPLKQRENELNEKLDALFENCGDVRSVAEIKAIYRLLKAIEALEQAEENLDLFRLFD